MFLENKYTKCYLNIIDKAKKQDRKKYKKSHINYTYYEQHHIIPTCLGGEDSFSNLVNLTAREHFICHKLLVRMVEGNSRYKMLEAAAIFSNNKNRTLKFSSRDISFIREANATASSIRNKGNAHYLKRKETSPELRLFRSNKVKESKWVNNKLVEQLTPNYIYYVTNLNYSYGRLPLTEEQLRNRPKGHLGKRHSEEAKERIRQAHLGKSVSLLHRQNMSIAAKNRPRHICEHCGLSCIGTNYKRWHGPKCRQQTSA